LLLLEGDKCFRTMEELERRAVVSLARHGSISVTVNAHALEQVVRSWDGFALHTGSADTVFSCSAFVLRSSSERHPQLGLAFRSSVDDLGPRECQRLVWELRDAAGPPAWAALHLIRLSGYDPWAFTQYSGPLADALQDGGDEMLQRETAACLRRVAENDYWLGARKELFAFRMGRVFHALGMRGRALRWYQRSVERDGPSASTWFNMGLCHEAGDPAAAAQAFRRALELDPWLRRARQRLVALENAQRDGDGPG